MFTGNGKPGSRSQPGYELVEGGQQLELEGGRLQLHDGEQEWWCVRKAPAPVAAVLRALGLQSRHSLWRLAMPVILVLLSGTLFIVVSVSALRYLKLSGIYRPAYRSIPPISQAQIDTAASRHLTHEQCMASYPGLYESVGSFLPFRWLLPKASP